MGLPEDRERFREVGEARREDLAEFIRHGNLGGSGPDRVRIPIKIVDLPTFEYDQREAGGVGQGEDGQPQPGQPVEPEPGDDDESASPARRATSTSTTRWTPRSSHGSSTRSSGSTSSRRANAW
jgi:Uncharacterized conserved protein